MYIYIYIYISLIIKPNSVIIRSLSSHIFALPSRDFTDMSHALYFIMHILWQVASWIITKTILDACNYLRVLDCMPLIVIFYSCHTINDKINIVTELNCHMMSIIFRDVWISRLEPGFVLFISVFTSNKVMIEWTWKNIDICHLQYSGSIKLA